LTPIRLGQFSRHVNGDGFDDLLLAAFANPNGQSRAIVWSEFSANLNLSTLNGSNGD